MVRTLVLDILVLVLTCRIPILLHISTLQGAPDCQEEVTGYSVVTILVLQHIGTYTTGTTGSGTGTGTTGTTGTNTTT